MQLHVKSTPLAIHVTFFQSCLFSCGLSILNRSDHHCYHTWPEHGIWCKGGGGQAILWREMVRQTSAKVFYLLHVCFILALERTSILWLNQRTEELRRELPTSTADLLSSFFSFFLVPLFLPYRTAKLLSNFCLIMLN